MIVKRPEFITEEKLREMAREARGQIKNIYLHWTRGRYGQPDDRFHLSVDRLGQVYVHCKILAAKKDHTWLRNEGGLSIAMCCGADSACWTPCGFNPRTVKAVYENIQGAAPDCAKINFGAAPPTCVQIEKMAKVAALVCEELGLPVGRDTVITHAEVAFKDGYGPGSGDANACWDLWFLPDAEQHGKLVPGGELIRGKAIAFQEEMKKERKGCPAA